MGQALYRKYRSKSLSEIVGQEHITDTLGKALKAGRISHAYLLTGPRGVGKTSIARILAHEINNLPYDEDQTHIDIIEIDAASNRRIDEIRDLRDKVNIAPAAAKYKVYIIDEVHMLTKEAFNALLKTLEEPPAHVVFILATTEAHKLPETIISRTQRFIFRPIDETKAVGHLREIATKEKIDISDEALALIAQHGDGSFRDSISLLDQAGSHGAKVEVSTVQTMLGIPPEQATNELLATVQSGEIQMLLTQLNAIYDQGFQAASIAKHLSHAVRNTIIAQTADNESAIALLEKLLEVPVSHNPERYLEIVLLQALHAIALSKVAKTSIVQHVAEALITKQSAPPQKKIVAIQTVESKSKPLSKESTTANEPAKVQDKTSFVDESIWPKVLGVLKQQYNTLYGIVRMAQPDFSEAGRLDLAFAFAFHQKRAHEAKNLQAISTAITTVTGQKLEITCSLNPDLKLANKKPLEVATLPELTPGTHEPDESLSAISNIFGGGELLQS